MSPSADLEGKSTLKCLTWLSLILVSGGILEIFQSYTVGPERTFKCLYRIPDIIYELLNGEDLTEGKVTMYSLLHFAFYLRLILACTRKCHWLLFYH